jgi:hypothetical protein
MPDDPSQERLKLRIAAHLKRVRAETYLTAEMVRRSREQLAKSRDLLRSTEMHGKPDAFLGRQHHKPIPLPQREE